MIAKLWLDISDCMRAAERRGDSGAIEAYGYAAMLTLERFDMTVDDARDLLERDAKVTELRGRLRTECEECPACGGDVADEPDDNILLAWLGGATLDSDLFGGMCPAWVGHLKEEWRQQP